MTINRLEVILILLLYALGVVLGVLGWPRLGPAFEGIAFGWAVGGFALQVWNKEKVE